MLPKAHILAGGIFSILLWLIFPQITIFKAAIVFLSSFLIDVDHYLYFVYKEKQWHPKKSVNWYLKDKEKFDKLTPKQKQEIYTGLCFLHGVEALVILILIALMFDNLKFIVLPIIIGFIFHQALDALDLYRRDYRFDKVISFIYSVVNVRNKKLLQDI